MNDLAVDDDPNAATRTQQQLKRVETAIRQQGDSDLFLLLDGVALLKDESQVKAGMIQLKQRLEAKPKG